MRRLAVPLIVLGIFLAAARLFTGIYYRSDSGEAYLVLKPVLDAAIERSRTDGALFDHAVVLDSDEIDFAYGPLYRGTMKAVPVLAVLLVGAGALLLRRRREPLRS